MKRFLNFSYLFAKLLKDDSGQDLVEYALVACLIGLGAVVAVKGMGAKVVASFAYMNSTLNSSF